MQSTSLKLMKTSPCFQIQLKIYSLAILQITAYNEYSREVTHIFLRYTGDLDSVREERSSDRFAKFYVDGVAVTSFDSGLNPGNAFIQVSFENRDYVRYILRPAFDYTQDATLNIAGKLASLAS